MEFNRRVAMEKDVDKTDSLHLTRLTFDESGNFLLVPTMIGIKVINLVTNKLARLIGKPENMRFLQLALFQVSFTIYYYYCMESNIEREFITGKSQKVCRCNYTRNRGVRESNVRITRNRSNLVCHCLQKESFLFVFKVLLSRLF